MALVEISWTNPDNPFESIDLKFNGEVLDDVELYNSSFSRSISGVGYKEYVVAVNTYTVTFKRLTKTQFDKLKIILEKGQVSLVSPDDDIYISKCLITNESLGFTRQRNIITKQFLYNGTLDMEEVR